MNNTGKAAVIGVGAAVIIGGSLVLQKLGVWFPSEPTGPGSGMEIPYTPEPTGPGSGDEMPAEPEGPGSGDEVPYDPEAEPTGPGSGEYELTGPGSGEEISQSDELKDKAKASCSAIEKGSTCIEYIGSFWLSAVNTELNCKGAGTYSKKPCPRPVAGGCRVSVGTMNEIVIWHYSYGGDPFTAEVLFNTSKVCDANPMGSWVFGN